MNFKVPVALYLSASLIMHAPSWCALFLIGVRVDDNQLNNRIFLIGTVSAQRYVRTT